MWPSCAGIIRCRLKAAQVRGQDWDTSKMSIEMKAVIATFVLLLSVPINVEASEPTDVVNPGICLNAKSGIGSCLAAQIQDCQASVNDSNGYYGECELDAIGKANKFLNEMYSIAINRARQADLGNRGSPYTGNEELLRSAQRAWIRVRDDTCGTKYTMQGTDTDHDQSTTLCGASLSIHRAAVLQEEIVSNPN